MGNQNEYRNLKKLVNSLASNLDALENGNLSPSDIYSLLDDARNIHERMAVLHYLAIERAVKKEDDKGGIKFNFATTDEELEIPANQTNLIDAIKVEHHTEAVKKSIGEQQPLFEEEDKVEESKIEEESIVEKEVPKEVTASKEIENTPKSINEQFSGTADQPTMADKLGQQPIKDLTSAIGLNQKFLFMNDLFEGENNKYKDAIDLINSANDFAEAENYINGTLKSQFSWDMNGVSAQKFMNLVKRRFL